MEEFCKETVHSSDNEKSLEPVYESLRQPDLNSHKTVDSSDNERSLEPVKESLRASDCGFD